MKDYLNYSGESIALLYVGVLSYDDLTVNPCGIGEWSGTLHVVEVTRKLSDLLVHRVVLLSDIYDIAVVLPMEDEESLTVFGELLELPAVGVECDLVQKNKTIACIILTEIGKINLVTALDVIVTEDTLVLGLSFGYPFQFLRRDLRKHGGFSAARQTKETSYHLRLPDVQKM